MTTVDWWPLTRSPEKAEYYQHDVYFREALAEVRELAGEASTQVLRESALMMVRPEGLAAGRLTPVHRFLGEHGYQIVAVESVRLSRMLLRELWRYQHTMASLDRLAVVDQMLSVGPALLLLLRRTDATDLPASVGLSVLKGASNPANRPPGTLRERLAQPNRLFAMVHCADEPADLVRELGILLDVPARRAGIRALVSGQLSDEGARTLAAALRRDEREARALDPEAALRRLLTQVNTAGPAGRHAAAMLDSTRLGRRIPWRAFLRELAALPVTTDQWDLALVGSTWIDYDEPGTTKLLGGPDVDCWRQDTG